ncbi:MAG: SAM-dependent methyltransferase [candidate division Zixibacteria bacterium]|nr:SAM-dependent methyltransferase [candidate division Zixibacteria bacterium]MBU1471121.1 SAM-dependent methyltransferase [candidate division Zixibacteria bacterium]MBU2624606.1 SAM-dependent methyltransferase [candidate division Zixibacteria bacterium]
MGKRQEANDVVQFLLPELEKAGIARANMKVDVTTQRSGLKRGDVWVSRFPQSDKRFEKGIIALIEAKHRNASVGDIDWRDAMRQGKEKAPRQGLSYYIVTNCITDYRYYNCHNDEEVLLDGSILIRPVPANILNKIQSQVSADNSYVVHKASLDTRPISESRFRATLKNLADIYRSAGLRKGDERIDPTISFVVLKYIDEKEAEDRTLPPEIKLWTAHKAIASGQEAGDLKAEFNSMRSHLWDPESDYKSNHYRDFADLCDFPGKLKSDHFKRIYAELDPYHFHGARFDLFGAIYEEFASQDKKKEFGEFYTRRHITGMVARILLRNERVPRKMRVCDPACGAGGFLTEAYKALHINYSTNGRLNRHVLDDLKERTFWGYDNVDKSVARTKLNMFLVGDGHIHIHENDSLISWNDEYGWTENTFDYVLTNPPMGKYEGEANISDFAFTNERRMEMLFVERVIESTKYGGEIAIVLNDGALEAPTRERFRIKLLEATDVIATVSLTKFAFAPYTKEKTYVLFLRKKQADDVGKKQDFPIWHFILDYDGYANSDKRFKTKYHDDLPVLEDKFSPAVETANLYLTNKEEFQARRHMFERSANTREKDEGILGLKCGFVLPEQVNPENFHNLLSEFHLRPIVMDSRDIFKSCG